MRRKAVTEIGFDSNVTAPWTYWTDVSGDVSSINASYGRNAELDTIESGECTIVLDNTDGVYTPGRASSPYAGRIRSRRPLRVYTTVDDNLVPFQCVRPRQGDLNPPSFSSTNTGVVSVVTDDVLGVPVWQVGASNTGDVHVSVGGNSDVDQISVKAGEQVRFSARVRVTDPTVVARLGIYRWDKVNGGNSPAFLFSNESSNSDGTWKQIRVWYTVPADCNLRMAVWMTRPNGTGSARWYDLKMNRGSVAGEPDYSDYVTTGASGRYPVHRGYIDSWEVDTNGYSSEATIKSVDWLGVASRPINSMMRESMSRSLANLTINPVTDSLWYWPCVEGEADPEAVPVYHTGTPHPLKVIQSSFPPSVGGFTTEDRAVPFHDGTSGGFTVDDDNLAKGAVLSLTRGGVPQIPFKIAHVPQGEGGGDEGELYWWGTAFWVKGKVPSAGRSCLWWYADAGRTRQVGLFVDSSGNVIVESTAQGFTADYVEDTGFNLATNESAYFRVRVSFYTGAGGMTVAVSKNGSAFYTLDGFWVYGAASAAFIQWGGRIVPGVEADFFHGTIAHVMFATGETVFNTAAGYLWEAGLSNWGYRENNQIGDLLDFAGFKLGRRVDSGKSWLMPPSWDSGSDANGMLSATAEDAGGMFFMSPAGEAVYHNRDRRMAVPAPRFTVAEWSDRLRWTLNASQIVNHVTAERPDGVSRTVQDEASVAEYGLLDRKVRRNVQSTAELVDAAGWILHRYRESLPRCESLVIDASALNGTDDVLAQFAYGGTLNDKVTLTGLPASAPADTLSYFIEGVSTSIEVDGSQLNYVVTFNISDANRSAAFVIGHPEFGLLDSDAAVLIY